MPDDGKVRAHEVEKILDVVIDVMFDLSQSARLGEEKLRAVKADIEEGKDEEND